MTVLSRWNLSIFPCTCYVHYKWSVHINRTWTWKSTPVCYHNRTEEAKNSDARCRQHHQQSHHHSPHGKRRNWTISTVEWSKAAIWLEPTAVKGSSVKPRADDKMSTLALLLFRILSEWSDIEFEKEMIWHRSQLHTFLRLSLKKNVFSFIDENLHLLRRNHFDIQAALS